MKDQVRTPLRTVLRNFLNHIEKLESSTCPEKSYDAEFQDLKLFSESVKSLKEYACTEGEKETNRKKNRYKDILPFDVSRVILNEYAGIPGSDYINANYIKGASGSPAYIASQGPLPCTVNDFWRMVVQCEVQVIVMACNVEEAGKAKCEKYWVDEGEEKQFGMISVKLLKASTVCPDFSVRTMRLKYTNSQNVIEERTVCQLHYVAWPDHGVPSVVQPLLDMVRLKLTDDFSLLALIREMRKQRIAMVQTKEQYVLVHQAVRELFKEQLLMIDSHPYENVDPDGLLIIKEEENHYDTVENLANLNIEEKKDNTMEKDVAPPLPQKKHSFYPSKQDKDVENLSAQQRSITHNTEKKPVVASTSSRPSPRTPMEIPQQPMRQLVQKKLSNPIPSKGILKVPHLKSLSNSATPIKRSKSLKLTNMAFKQKIAVSSDVAVEIKRRGSLESNIDETGSVLGDGHYNNVSYEDVSSPKEVVEASPIYDSPRNIQKYEKYDMLNYLEDKRLLVRSLTAFDMRQKSAVSVVPVPVKSAGRSPAKCKLSRSNTQIDFSRAFKSRIIGSKGEADKSSAPKQYGSEHTPLAVFITQNENAHRFLDRFHKTGAKDVVEGHAHHSIDVSDGSKPPSSYQADFKTPPPRGEVPSHSVNQKDMVAVTTVNGNQSKRGHVDMVAPQNFSSSGANYSGYRYELRTNAFASSSKPRIANDVSYSRYSSPSTSRNVESQKSKPGVLKHAIHQQHLNGIPPLIDSHQKFSYLNGYTQLPPMNLRHHKPVDKDSRNPLPGHGKDAYGPSQPFKPEMNAGPSHDFARPSQSHLKSSASVPHHYPFGDKAAMMRKPLDHSAALRNKRGVYSPRENEERYGLDNSQRHSPVHKAAVEADLKQPTAPNPPPGRLWPPPFQLSEQSSDRNVGDKSDSKLKKNVGPSGGKMDAVPKQDHDLKRCDYFSNAPGVDIDQVAASIPQKDASKTKLMKVALEAFSMRRSRQQARLPDSSPSTSSSSKGSSPSSTMVGSKKRQQQYL